VVSLKNQQFRRFQLDLLLHIVLSAQVLDHDLVSDEEIDRLFVEEVPVSSFGCVSGAIVTLQKVALVENGDGLFGVLQAPLILVFVEHEVDEFLFARAVPSGDTNNEGLAVFDGEVGHNGAQLLQVQVFLCGFDGFWSGHVILVRAVRLHLRGRIYMTIDDMLSTNK
jgi:hypothetical protein